MKSKPRPKLYHNMSAWLSIAWTIWFAIESIKGTSTDRFILTLGIISVSIVVQTFGEHLRDLIIYYNEKE